MLIKSSWLNSGLELALLTAQQDSQSNQHVPTSSDSAIVDWSTTPTFDDLDTM